MSSDISAIFQGVPRKFSRDWVTEFLKKEKFDKYYVPLSGRFAMAQTIARAGVDPTKIFCSDIGLFSCAMGYYLADKDVKELRVEFDSQIFQGNDVPQDNLGLVTHILYAIKWCQLKKAKNEYMRFAFQEFARRQKTYLKNIQQGLDDHKRLLDGMHYEIRDAREIIQQVKDENAFIFINPPAYKGGYLKMFPIGDWIEWNEPGDIEEWDPKEYTAILDQLSGAKCTATSYRYKDLKDMPESWYAVSAEVILKDRIDYLIANKKTDTLRIMTKVEKFPAPTFPIYDDAEIWKGSKIDIVPLMREDAFYYRDLFVHKLSSVSAQVNIGWLIDGKIFTVSGYDVTQAARGNLGYVHETYGISIPSAKYPRLNRLFMYFTTCQQFFDELSKMVNVKTVEIKGMKTVCLSRMPEVRINHGLLKKIKSEQQKDGTWRLEYYHDWWPKKFKACIIEWMDELERDKRRG